MLTIIWAFSELTQHQRSLITDHNKYNNNEKIWNAARITEMWQRLSEQMLLEKWHAIVLLTIGLPPNFSLFFLKKTVKKKAVSLKYNEVKEGQ